MKKSSKCLVNCQRSQSLEYNGQLLGGEQWPGVNGEEDSEQETSGQDMYSIVGGEQWPGVNGEEVDSEQRASKQDMYSIVGGE